MQVFFTSGRDPNILISLTEDCIIFVIWAARVLFNFYRKQKQVFQSEALLEILTLSASMEEFGLDNQK